jgi:hypothetical protein
MILWSAWGNLYQQVFDSEQRSFRRSIKITLIKLIYRAKVLKSTIFEIYQYELRYTTLD